MKLAFYTLTLFLSQQIIGLYSETRVSIIGTNDTFNVDQYGEQRSIISDADAQQWHLFTDYDCKSAVGQALGSTPDDCYLKEPTPWNLYDSYGWQEVTSIYKPISGRYLDKSSEPVALLKRSYSNQLDFPITVGLDLSQTVTDTVTHRKTYGNEFGVKGSADFSIWVIDASVEMDYTHTWGTEETQEKQKTVSVTDSISATIPPHTNLTFTLAAYNIKARFEVVCSNYLEGYAAANYASEYKGHYFWAASTDTLEPSKNAKQMTETITVDFYSEGFVQATKLDLKNHTAVPVDVPLSDVLHPPVLYAD